MISRLEGARLYSSSINFGFRSIQHIYNVNKNLTNKIFLFSGVDIHRSRSKHNERVHRNNSRERSGHHDHCVASAAASRRGRLAGGVRGQRGRGRRAAHARARQRHAALARRAHARRHPERRLRPHDPGRHDHGGRRARLLLRARAQPCARACSHGAPPVDGRLEQLQRRPTRRPLVRQCAVLIRRIRATGIVQVPLINDYKCEGTI